MDEPFELEIDLNVLNHLGLNLYSNVPAVLSELIANAWDADATRVDITIIRSPGSPDQNGIVITDNGCGMDDADLRGKYLKVGFQRRQGSLGDQTSAGRPVMGRKGIGKLSIFSIAENAKIFTRKEAMDPIGIEMDEANIRAAIKKGDKYHPVKMEAAGKVPESSGTVIELRKLKKRVNATLDQYVRQRVARRFSVVSEKFQVFVDGEKITIQDRNYFSKLENAFVYGDFDTDRFSHDEKYISKRDNVVSKIEGYRVSGWIGLVRESGSLKGDSGNLNKVAILARGKVALEDILERLHIASLYANYVIGEIEADFLDLTDLDDIATSNRQDFIQDDERFTALRDFMKRELAALRESRAGMKADEGERRAVEIPAIKEWYNSLNGDTKAEAKKLFGKINQIATDDEHRKTLYKHGVLAFEHLRHKEKLAQLGNLDMGNLEATVKLFSELDDIEASWYHEITRGRLDMIRKLRKLVDDNDFEEMIQKHIYTHLWLLDPSWDRATETPSMEKTVRTDFDRLSKKLSQEERDGRIDIRYKKTSGKHVIVELKRASVKTTSWMLGNQVQKYLDALKKQIDEHREYGPVEAVCLLGHLPTDWTSQNQRQDELNLTTRGIRVMTYRSLIKDAEKSYDEYLRKAEDRGRIKKLLDAIEESG
ncbi:MAG: ATP-binding protein [Gammaproteobacteria bacterium]|nr:ATP-binding protein [Gammaproteobacteria bacterium]